MQLNFNISSDVTKFNASNTFVKILEEIYNSNAKSMNLQMDVQTLQDMFDFIDKNYALATREPKAMDHRINQNILTCRTSAIQTQENENALVLKK